MLKLRKKKIKGGDEFKPKKIKNTRKELEKEGKSKRWKERERGKMELELKAVEDRIHFGE